MIDPAKGIALDALARLHQTTAADLRALIVVPDPDLDNMPNASLAGDLDLLFANRYDYAAALSIEIARQLHDDKGLPLSEGLRLASYTGAVRLFLDRSHDEDFWVAIVGSRNEWGKEPRGAWPVGTFGPAEFWSTMHFAGSFHYIASEIATWMRADAREYGSVPARIFMANVSTADRRLRKRAADLGIKIAGNAFI